MKTNKTALAIIAITVIVAGCTDGGGDESASTTGVQITNFSATPSQTFGGQSTQLSMAVSNQGGVNADNSYAKLYQAPIGDTEGQWSFESDDGSAIVDVGTVRAGDPENNVPPQTKRQNWALNAPNLGAQSIDYNFQTRLFYDYETQATTQIELVQNDEYIQGDYSPSRPTTSNTDGPIQIEVNTRTPVRYYSDDGIDSDLCVTVRNEGQGTPLAPSISDYIERVNDNEGSAIEDINVDSGRDKVKISVRDSAGVDFGGDDNSVSHQVSLVGSRGNHCFDPSLPEPSAFSITQTVPITVTAEYGYYTDSSTTVTVEPSR